jgi:hypothetical protein
MHNVKLSERTLLPNQLYTYFIFYTEEPFSNFSRIATHSTWFIVKVEILTSGVAEDYGINPLKTKRICFI